MTPLDRFNAWSEGRGGAGSGMTYGRAWQLANDLGHSDEDIIKAMIQIKHWLAANENTGKANKRLWGKFFLNWLKNGSYRQQSGRLAPSTFKEE